MNYSFVFIKLKEVIEIALKLTKYLIAFIEMVVRDKTIFWVSKNYNDFWFRRLKTFFEEVIIQVGFYKARTLNSTTLSMHRG